MVSGNKQAASYYQSSVLLGRIRSVEFGFFISKPFWFFLSNFGFLSFLRIFESLAASEIEQVASKHEKNVDFGHFINIRNDFGQKRISSQVSGQKWAKSEKKRICDRKRLRN